MNEICFCTRLKIIKNKHVCIEVIGSCFTAKLLIYINHLQRTCEHVGKEVGSVAEIIIPGKKINHLQLRSEFEYILWKMSIHLIGYKREFCPFGTEISRKNNTHLSVNVKLLTKKSHTVQQCPENRQK